jgi:alcohol dehydrogenase, propanol-preferring
MRAMVLLEAKTPLQLMDLPIPQPDESQVLIHVEACGVCRTDLHIFDGELSHPKLPLVLGHQIVGTIVQLGSQCRKFSLGQRVGVPWLGQSCQHCEYCQVGQENLCDHALYTGYQVNGGFAEYCVANENYIFPIPDSYSSAHAAPLLCAGLIGYRTLRLAGEGKHLGFYGFGAAAHILLQVARYQHKEVWAFTRPGDSKTQAFAKNLGAIWAGGSDEKPPIKLDSALIFAPIGELVPLALQAIKKGGSVVCAGIYMTDIPSFPYDLLYGERVLRSVTNLTREDGRQFFDLLQQVKIETVINSYPLEKANQAMMDLKNGKIEGSAVVVIDSKNTK